MPQLTERGAKVLMFGNGLLMGWLSDTTAAGGLGILITMLILIKYD